MTGGRTGRRPGTPDTRQAILVAARGRFAEAGYRGASIRAIAAEAGVDPALVHHYFGTKRALFAAVLEVPADPADVARRIVAAPRDEIGTAVVRTFISVWGPPERRERLRVLLASVATDPEVAGLVREFVVDALLGPVAESLEVDRPRLRATLAGSQVIGFALLAYVIGIEPLASLDAEEIVAIYAPTIQHYLTGDLDGPMGA
ncbi:MAG TPA: TetR family transcriptional regulator [Egicoccus sp.]|nr:TetR family transcriptional regulator [Egicoccus sp.]HSK22434.1 TetR family transcriptional regulator [Egicoccus sp.]